MTEIQSDLIIQNGLIITLNDANEILDQGDVMIKDGKIESISEGSCHQTQAETVIDASGCIVMPGLVNSHTHLPMSLFRGMADDLELMTWLNDHIFPAEAAYINPETVKLGALLSCAEMLLSGTTACCDGYFHEDHVADAVLATGMRAVLGQGIIDYPAPGVPDPSLNVAVAARFTDHYLNKSPMITPSFFCHSPYTCSEQTLVRAKEEANKRGVLFQIHAAETRNEVEMLNRDKQMSVAAYLDSLGILDEKTLLIHSVWMTDTDLDIIASKGAHISHNPESNMKLASGVMPLSACLSRGITVGLGTDGSASNNDLDLFCEMDTVAKLHKVVSENPVEADALTVLTMATKNSAKGIGLKGVGALLPGNCADIIIVNTRKPHLQPLYNPISQLVYSAKGSDVRDVIINGRVLVENRQLKTIDLVALFEQVADFKNKVLAN